MANDAPPSVDNIVTVPLFESGHAGYGDGRVITNPSKYNRVIGSMDLTHPGEIRMGPSFTTLAYSATLSRPPVWAGEARDASAVPRQPLLLFIADLTVYQILGGVVSSRITLAQIATDACFHDNGSGVARLIVAEGSAGNIASYSMISATDAIDTITGTIQRDKLASISGALYGSAVPSGARRWNGVTFCPYGSAPTTAANWSPITRVGSALTDINQIRQVRGVPVVLKPEGIFMYNTNLSQWENMMPAWEYEPHPQNGRGAMSVGPDLLVPMGRGGAVIFDGYTVKDISPYGPLSTPNGDTTSQVFSAMGVYRNWIVGVTAVSRGYVGGAGSKEAHEVSGIATTNQKELAVGTSTTEGIRVWKTQDN